MVRAHIEAWEGAVEESEPLVAMLPGAIVNEHASTQLRDFIQSRLTRDMAAHSEDATMRAGLAVAMLVGIIISRRIIGVPILVAPHTETLVKIVGPVIQQLLGGDS